MPRRVMLTVASAVAGVSLLPCNALAGPGDGSGQGTGGQTGDVIVATVSYSTTGSTGGGGLCEWEMVDGEIGVNNLGIAAWPYTRNGVTFHLWRRECPDGTAWVQLPEVTARDLLPEALRELRERRLPQPEPTFHVLDPEHGWAYVQTPLDFRVSDQSWRAVSVTASLGPIWASVTARPETLTFDSGDPAGPGPVSCGGSDPIAPYAPEEPGECSYTYVNGSSTSLLDGYHFDSTTSITWSISWASSTGAGGVLPQYSTSSSTLLAVAEVQGLVSCTGPRPEEGGC